ncbi:MAG: ABC transporter permease [Anaerolineae bacterium]
MRRYVIRRSIQSVFLLLGISIISFSLMHLAPGGPVQFIEDPRLTQKHKEALEHALGLDRPLPVQYLMWLWGGDGKGGLRKLWEIDAEGRLRLFPEGKGGILWGDFGRSYVSHRPVLNMIVERIPATVELAGAGMILGLLGGIPLGIYAALKRGTSFDNVVRVLTVIGNAVPHWWLGLMLIILFASTVRIFPSGGRYTLGRGDILDRLWHLALPAVIASMGGWITYSRFMRYEVLEVLRQDYVRTAYAKGLQRRTVLLRHVLRNAILPVVTMMGGILTIVISGAVLFENVFAWPGMGRLSVEAFFKRDYPLLMALNMISSFLVITGNLLADIAYGFVDPRVKYE